MKKCGIYVQTNTINNKKYIGLSKNIEARQIKHEQNARLGIKSKFYNALRKYGSFIFVKEILESCDSKSDVMYLLEREKHYMLLFDTLNNGYNSSITYDTITNNPNREEICKKISNNKKELNKYQIHLDKVTKCVNADLLHEFLDIGWVLGRGECSEIHKKNVSNALKNKQKNGYKHSEEALKIMSQTFKGKTHTEETKKQMSENSKGKYSLNQFIKKYGNVEGNIKYTEKCQKLKDRKMTTGLDQYIDRYGIEDGQNKYNLKQEKENNKKRIHINNGIMGKMILKEELDFYINNGQIKGLINKIK